MRTVDAAGLEIGDAFPPRIMGVLNLSPESPYDPSVFSDPGDAATYIDEELVGEGADIVDVGLESANKRFEALSADEELARLDTAIDTIESTESETVFSIETRYGEVADAALSCGFDVVNDVCGFADPEMARVCTEYDAAVVKMASPPDLRRPGAIETVDGIYEALSRGELTEKTIVDPAFGGWSAGKTTAVDRETFRRLREFRGLGRPILVSINRKNFVREIPGRSTEAALPASLAATAMAVERGANVIRTHDVAETRDAALVGETLARDRVSVSEGSVAIEELDIETPRAAAHHGDRIGADANPEAAVTRVFEVRGLTPDEHRVVAAAASANGAVCASGATHAARRVSDGGRTDDGTATERPSEPEGILLFGTVASLRAVAASIEHDRPTMRAGTVVTNVTAALRAALE